MRKGEKGILIGIGVFALGSMLLKAVFMEKPTAENSQIPFYSTAAPEMQKSAATLMRRYVCRDCHTFWGKRNIMQTVPAPSLDGVGSLKSREWLLDYLSAPDPQAILPSRLKPEFRMPSYAQLPQQERELLADYLASLKVKDWYLEEAKKSEYEKLTGKTYSP